MFLKNNLCFGNNLNDISVFTGTVPWEETASHLPLSASFSLHQISWQQIPVYQRLQKYRLLKAYITDWEERNRGLWVRINEYLKEKKDLSAIVPVFCLLCSCTLDYTFLWFLQIVVETIKWFRNAMSYLFTLAPNKPCAVKHSLN